ncbi:MAG: prepilin peptidase [Ilumatobacteraceae bacterium]|nr:prepilin peptidase [Ilumatobacteraceae bacterium]
MWWLAAVVGSVTALVGLRAETFAGAALTVVVAGLLMVQTPMDLRTRHLSRQATVIAVALVSAVIAVDVIGDGVVRAAVVAVGVAAVVVAVYALLHRLSPRSLGWGDVLLVAPLGLALGYVAADRVAVWQLLASSTGAVHALVLRRMRGASGIPFGPHLLVAAWLVLLASV